MTAEIVESTSDELPACADGLAGLLVDAVAGGASVGFVEPLSRGRASGGGPGPRRCRTASWRCGWPATLFYKRVG
ncbi:hypothetical protein B0I31_101647 [Saccharothrix carnea]|uniref:Uncharacterized protein n=1 Tax=Saccharothrix carnea TaxID=1280637 RepID=A0A2P8IJ27_SACCR|nr:hypothetical protein [Saccharothrix carnea]PSL58429.1 hypothetical protein B0I31_101647 [Saccharothrix carnea]